jgi:hypothetical protein
MSFIATMTPIVALPFIVGLFYYCGMLFNNAYLLEYDIPNPRSISKKQSIEIILDGFIILFRNIFGWLWFGAFITLLFYVVYGFQLLASMKVLDEGFIGLFLYLWMFFGMTSIFFILRNCLMKLIRGLGRLDAKNEKRKHTQKLHNPTTSTGYLYTFKDDTVPVLGFEIAEGECFLAVYTATGTQIHPKSNVRQIQKYPFQINIR